MEPRQKWSKILLAAKTFLFHLFSFYFMPCWNKIILKNFAPEPPPLVTHAKNICFISDVVPC